MGGCEWEISGIFVACCALLRAGRALLLTPRYTSKKYCEPLWDSQYFKWSLSMFSDR